jgi:hypothetical protein
MFIMDVWRIRNQALLAIESDLKAENDTFVEALVLMKMGIERLLTQAKGSNEQFALVCCHTLIKARRYALACYSVCLDGLAQEGGALYRPLVEAWEQLIFYAQDPTRTQMAIDGNLPQAGEIGKAIGSELQGLRKYLNWNASHFSFTEDSLQPIQDVYNGEQLKTNLRVLYTTVWLTTREATSCLLTIGELDDDFKAAINESQAHGLSVFHIDELTS